MITNLSEIRNQYLKNKLNKKDSLPDPFIQFEKWLSEAIVEGANQPTAMSLSTASKSGTVSSRVVLLKSLENNVFTFFTNYKSKKGIQINENANAALLFFWPELERQVRIEGIISKIKKEQSDYYFNRRPEESQISASISPQSQPVPDRNYLENMQTQFKNKHEGETLSRPSHWGGYCLVPSLIEFWQGRANRLHDRIQYTQNNGIWEIERIAP